MDKQYFLNKVSIFKPNNFKIYNYDLVPNNFHYDTKIPIICKIHGIFYHKVTYHIYNSGCAKCGLINQGLKRRKTTEDFIKKSIEKFGNKYIFSKTTYVRKGDKLILICPKHGEFTIRPEAHLWSKEGCPKCDYELPRMNRGIIFISESKKRYNHKYDYSKVNYVNSNTEVEIVCPIHGSFYQKPAIHLSGKIGCPKCSRDLEKVNIISFIDRSKNIHKNKYDYSEVNFTKLSDKIVIICKIHGKYYQRANSHLQGNGCLKCGVDGTFSSKEKFIEISKKIHGEKYNYSKVIYKGNKRKVEIICSKHGSFWQKPNSHTSSKCGCQLCFESKGEITVEKILKKYNIRYIREYKIDNYPYRYDFYLPDYNIFIEYNGLQHYAPVEIFGGLDTFKKTKERDRNKKIIIDINKGFLIIIPYQNSTEENIEKVLINGLKRKFKYWFLINDKIHVFNYFRDVIKEFDLPKQTDCLDLISTMKCKIKDFNLLFKK